MALTALGACSSSPAPAGKGDPVEVVREEQGGSFLWLKGAPQAGEPRAVAMKTLHALADRFRLKGAALDLAYLAALHDTGTGPYVARFEQKLDGVEIFQSQIALMMKRDLSPVAITGKMARSTRVVGAFARDALSAIDAAHGTAHAVRAGEKNGYELFTIDGSKARARRVYFEGKKGLVPAHYVEIAELKKSFVVSATDGEVLFTHDLTANDAYAFKVWADQASKWPHDGPHGFAGTPHPTGLTDGYQAPFVEQTTITLQNFPFSKNDPWLPPNAQSLTGNNAIAYADINRPNGAGTGDVTVPPSGANAFEYLYDTHQGPKATEASSRGSATHMFYVVNFLHDWFYDSGYDEKSFNAQENNYGRGGVGGDPVLAEVQDYSGTNNANAYTPADGDSPQIQMFIFNGESNANINVASPAPIAGTLQVNSASFGPGSFTLNGQVALLDDGVGTTSDGCEEPLVNAAALSGKIALVDRGTCPFTDKVQRAQAAGAVGVIIANNAAGEAPSLGGNPSQTIRIPVLSVSQADGTKLKGAIAGGVTITMTREAGIDRDGGLDSTIVAHEWGHTLTNRLIGNGNGLVNTQGRGMGEGWGDFVGLLLSVREADKDLPANKNYSGTYATGGYVSSGGTNNGHYFGFRRYPYSTDMKKNPLTFGMIQNGEPLPSGIPVQFGEDGAQNAEVHNAGEFWAAVLWECYAALLNDAPRLTFAEANKRMRDYLIASLKLTPLAPTFLEARDAVLAAAYATDAKDFELFAKAFAKRGMGTGAIGPARASRDNKGVKESYIAGNDFEFIKAVLDDSVVSCDKDGVLDNGETGKLTVTIRNSGIGTLQATTATLKSKSGAFTFPKGDKITFPATKPYQTVEASIEVALKGAEPSANLQLDIEMSDPQLAVPRIVPGALMEVYHYDVADASSRTDNVVGPSSPWVASNDAKLDASAKWTRVKDGTEQRWSIPANEAASDSYLVSPALEVEEGKPLVVKFSHRHSFERQRGENFDGGVVEISIDGGKTWKDAGGAAYGGKLAASSENPLVGRSAFVSKSANYPQFTTATLDLGTEYGGKTALLRFRVGTDEGTGDEGWQIDDIEVSGIKNTPFPARVADRCGTTPKGNDPNPVTPPGNEAPADAGTLEGGGCGCSTVGAPNGGAYAALGALGLGLVLSRRRRR